LRQSGIRAGKVLSVYFKKGERKRKGKHSDTHDLHQSGIRAGVSLIFEAETGEIQFRQEGRGSLLIGKTGMPEEGIGQQEMLK
jgi:hypothetical protein